MFFLANLVCFFVLVFCTSHKQPRKMTLFGLIKKRQHLGQTSVQQDNTTSNNNTTTTTNPAWLRQFYIVLDEPHRLWKPSDVISGQIVMELRSDLHSLSLDLSLLGNIKIKLKNSTGTGLKTMKPFNFLNKETSVYKNAGLSRGLHKFPFNLKLPSYNCNNKLINELKFERGVVLYSLRSIIKSGNSNSDESTYCEVPFHVFVPLDVSPYQERPRNKTVVLQSSTTTTTTMSPITAKNKFNSSLHDNNEVASSTFTQTSTHSSSFNKIQTQDLSVATPPQQAKTVRISVSLPQSGFIIGETIPITLNLSHYKDYYHSTGIVITLARICRVGSPQDMNMETFRKDVCQSIHPLAIDSSTNFQYERTLSLRIPPDLFATFDHNNNTFTFNYYIEVLINLSRKNQVITNGNILLSPASNINSNSSTNNNNSDHKESRLLMLPKLMDDHVSSSSSHKSNSITEDRTIFNDNDMIDVEQLKRQRNVTGMSIEIILGNIRRKQKQKYKEPPPSSSGRVIGGDVLPMYTPPEDPEQRQFFDQSVIRNEDKQDLERLRLKEMESAPDMY